LHHDRADNIDETAAECATAKKFPGLKGMDLAKAVSTKKKNLSCGNDGAIWKTQARPPRPGAECMWIRVRISGLFSSEYSRILSEHGLPA